MFRTAGFFYLLFVPYYFALEKNANSIYEYNEDNFKQQIEELEGNFIFFYAPWCRDCAEFYPIWSELGQLINAKHTKFAIAEVDCTLHSKLCNEVDITGYPTLHYYHKNTFTPIEYTGTRDLASLTVFLSRIFTAKTEGSISDKDASKVVIYNGMAYLTDHNIEKFVSEGHHFVMFYSSWCRASQQLAPIWSELGRKYSYGTHVQVGKVNCVDNEMTCKNFDIKQYPYLMWIVNGRIMGVSDAKDMEGLEAYIQKMSLTENHDPEKFMKKKKSLPVARISEETFETFLEKEFVFINFFAPWCAHCMQMNPLWLKLGERFQNESRVLIADVDCVQSKPICETEKINGLPTLILYKEKKIVNVEHGGRPLESLISLVNEHLQDTGANTSQEQTAEEDILTKDEL